MRFLCSAVYIPIFIKIGSGIQKIIRGEGDSQTHRQDGDRISLLLIFLNKESRLIKGVPFPSAQFSGPTFPLSLVLITFLNNLLLK
jgi:hypothetical protein